MEKLPDPSGHPEPVNPVGELLQLVQYGVAVAAGIGGFLVLAAVLMTPTLGATRSAQLQWEKRKHQAQEAADKAARDQKPAETHHE
jgi:hypothetical protein